MLSLLLLVATVSASAQFEKNTKYVSASATGLGLSYSSAEKFTLGLDVTAGYFIKKAWMLYGKVGYDHTRYTDNFQIGAGGRYYFTQNGIYLGLGDALTTTLDYVVTSRNEDYWDKLIAEIQKNNGSSSEDEGIKEELEQIIAQIA